MAGQPQRRVIGIGPASAIVISNMVGTGIFTTTGFMLAGGAAPGDVLVAWLLGGVLAFCGALCYGELGANLPASGGEYHYLSRLLHPALGYVSGWVSLVAGFAAPIAAAAMAMHFYAAAVFPGWPVRTMAVATIVLLSGLHAADVRVGSRAQWWFTVVKVALIAALIAGVLLVRPDFTRLVEFRPRFWLSSPFAVMLIFVCFAYSGWNASAYIGAEIVAPERNLPRSLLIGTGVVMALYVLVNVAYLSAVPAEQLAGHKEVAQIVGAAQFGPRGGRAVAGLIALCLTGTVSAMVFIGPRVAEVMAADGLLPSRLARLSARGVPALAVWIQAIVSSLFAIAAVFDQLLIYVGYTLNIFGALTAVALVRLRRRGEARWQVCRGYPLPPLLFAAFALWMTVWSVRSAPRATLAGLATLLLPLAGWWIANGASRVRKHGPRARPGT